MSLSCFWNVAFIFGLRSGHTHVCECVYVCVHGVKQQAALACLLLAGASVGWTVCEDDRTCQQIASFLPLWPRTMGHHMLKWGNEWSSFVLAPRALDPAGASVALGPTQTDRSALCHVAGSLSAATCHP